MSKIPVYLCNKKRCENGACEVCHYTTDINFAERNTNDGPIVAYDLDEDELPFNHPNFKEVEK